MEANNGNKHNIKKAKRKELMEVIKRQEKEIEKGQREGKWGDKYSRGEKKQEERSKEWRGTIQKIKNGRKHNIVDSG